ncbi:hypothetical protein FB451DRAFT_372151 [Mycena latifolia]|nr:hypothetical protein FB451DRAFT_372151 [Mycena latifolia]
MPPPTHTSLTPHVLCPPMTLCTPSPTRHLRGLVHRLDSSTPTQLGSTPTRPSTPTPPQSIQRRRGHGVGVYPYTTNIMLLCLFFFLWAWVFFFYARLFNCLPSSLPLFFPPLPLLFPTSYVLLFLVHIHI